MSLTNSLLIGKSALLSHQQRIATISHNIANVNTKGYHRQTAALTAAPPLMPGKSSPKPYSVGSGVTISDIQRSYSRLQEMMFLGELSNSSYNSQRAQTLKAVESMLSGTMDNSLTIRLSEFWNAWQDVANAADNTALRTVLLNKASALTDYINTLYNNLAGFREQISAGDGTVADPFTGIVDIEVGNVNTIAEQIQGINAIMARLPASVSNDLLDRRDVLIRELAEKVNITVDLDFSIHVGGELLVSADGNERNDLIQTAGDPPAFSLDGEDITASLTGGTIGAWISLANEVDDRLTDLNDIAATLITEVNAMHTHVVGTHDAYDLNGDPGVAFFSGTTAENIAVDINDPLMVAAASTDNTGDGSNALTIAQLAFGVNPALDNLTFDNYIRSMLVSLGTSVQIAQARADDSGYVLNMLSDEIQRMSGVSMDEEMIDLISAQRAFAAAAKVITTVDTLMETILRM